MRDFQLKKGTITIDCEPTAIYLITHFTHQSGPLDINLLNEASRLVAGEHDFTSFSKNNPKIKNRKVHSV